MTPLRLQPGCPGTDNVWPQTARSMSWPPTVRRCSCSTGPVPGLDSQNAEHVLLSFSRSLILSRAQRTSLSQVPCRQTAANPWQLPQRISPSLGAGGGQTTVPLSARNRSSSLAAIGVLVQPQCPHGEGRTRVQSASVVQARE